MIEYKANEPIPTDTFIELLQRCSLGARRPVTNRHVIEQMMANASLTITAWDRDRLIGIARSLTDFSFVAYLADLAVDDEYQRQGIGKRLISETQSALEPSCKIVLLAAPTANEYYSALGFEHNPRAWVYTP